MSQIAEIHALKQRLQELELDAETYARKDRANYYLTKQCAEHRDGRLAALERAVLAERQRDELLTAAIDVVDRWHSPKWKDLPHTGTYIKALEDAISSVKCSAKSSAVPATVSYPSGSLGEEISGGYVL